MKERAAVSKGQHTVQGSALAAFLAVLSSGWERAERQSIVIMTIFHLSLSLCGWICHVLLLPVTGIGTCPTEILPGNKTKQQIFSHPLHCGDPEHHGANLSLLGSKELFPRGYIAAVTYQVSSVLVVTPSSKAAYGLSLPDPKTVKKLLYISYSSLDTWLDSQLMGSNPDSSQLKTQPLVLCLVFSSHWTSQGSKLMQGREIRPCLSELFWGLMCWVIYGQRGFFFPPLPLIKNAFIQQLWWKACEDPW